MPKGSESAVTRPDGTLDFSQGVDSHLVTTMQSDFNPNGLPRNMLAWLVNGTIRNGGISPRGGWQPLGTLIASGKVGFYQGGFLYQPLSGYPYPMWMMNGHLYMAPNVDSLAVTDLSAQFNLTMPANIQQMYLEQAEQFLIVQAGDYVTLPLFWDGTTLVRSRGIISPNNIPAAANGGVTTGGYTSISDLTSPVNVNLFNAGAVYTFNLSEPATLTLGQYIYVFGENDPSNITSNSLALLVNANNGGGSSFTATVYNAFGYYLQGSYTIPVGIEFFEQGNGTVTPTPSDNSTYNQLPASGPMCYYMGRLWYDQNGRKVTAGDIVGNQASGSAAYNYTDSVLYVTENPLAVGGDGFTIPSQAGNLRALAYAANLNTQLGQGLLYLFTREQIYALQVPVTRSDWEGANTSNQPLMFCIQVSTGSTSDRCVVAVNQDLIFQTFQPSIQSLQAIIRNSTQWGNVPISVNVQRAIANNDRTLLWAASGIYFDNRVIQTAAPTMGTYGVTHPLLVPLNFDAISTLNASLPPAWEGVLSGLDILQLFEGDYGGLDRAFALVISRVDQSLQLWELTTNNQRDNGDNRIEWVVEFPAFTWGRELELKELVSLELWLDNIYGTVEMTLDYRPDSDACWYQWHAWKVCAARAGETIPATPYPTTLGAGYKSTITLPHPPQQCNAWTGRPAFIGYQFQPRLTIKGTCRVRGIFLHGIDRQRKLYEGLVC